MPASTAVGAAPAVAGHCPAPTTRAPSLDAEAVRADIAALFGTEIFTSAEIRGALFKAAYISLILNLHELLHLLAARGDRVVLTDRDEDVVDLIQRARYAIVHSAGGAKRGRAAKARDAETYEVAAGEPSGFPDDIAVRLGGVRVLLGRDAAAAFDAACAILDRGDPAVRAREEVDRLR